MPFIDLSSIQFSSGPGGLSVAHLRCPHGSATVALHGGHVLEYTPKDQRPVLWLSDSAVFAPGKAIRGGIPVCWPWFGPHPENSEMPAHGFARNALWEVQMTHRTENTSSITLGLCDSDETRALWPYPFELTIAITLARSLTVALSAKNTGDADIVCSAALHSYFAISDISNIAITGLEGTAFRDQLDEDRIKSEQTPITFDREIDRVYRDTKAECIIDDSGWERKLHIAKSGSRSTVVWNPWIAKAARMADFGDDEYREMVCVETTNADDDTVTIAPGKTHVLTTELSASAG
ncbi:MAG: D-hexose-6-phosphate mutarotase [Verrucomicrobiae bacterium]|nr:D-hexose-6-phosphate mutarotase [Verrucomicrobiae bacterium]